MNMSSIDPAGDWCGVCCQYLSVNFVGELLTNLSAVTCALPPPSASYGVYLSIVASCFMQLPCLHFIYCWSMCNVHMCMVYLCSCSVCCCMVGVCIFNSWFGHAPCQMQAFPPSRLSLVICNTVVVRHVPEIHLRVGIRADGLASQDVSVPVLSFICGSL
jgi:hypothetical protein